MVNTIQNIVIAITVAALVIVSAILASIIFNLELVENLVMAWVLTTLYALFAFYLIDSSTTMIIRQKPIYVDREVIRQVPVQVPIQIPVENKTVEVIQVPGKTVYVDRPVIKTRTVYVEKKRKHLDIPKYNYIASTQTKRYHTRNCRLGKLVKRKYKIHSNSQAFFKKKKFKACKMCIRK